MENRSQRVYRVPGDAQEPRLDLFLAEREKEVSRSRIQKLIRDGQVQVNGFVTKPGYRLKAGDQVLFSVPPPISIALKPEAVDFEVIYEDGGMIVVNKPPGLVVHPAAGHATGTLVHGLLSHCKDFSGIGGELRPGIVHRLDKDTSGLLLVAKTDRVHVSLAGQFKSRTVRKEYLALVHGAMPAGRGEIDLPIARHPKKRKEMSVVEGGRTAVTVWRLTEEFEGPFSLLAVVLKTGRTHQIRVHMAHVGHPIVGDRVYGYGKDWWKRHTLNKECPLPEIPRQMLHAHRLGFAHPETGAPVEFEAELPDDMRGVLEALKTRATCGKGTPRQAGI